MLELFFGQMAMTNIPVIFSSNLIVGMTGLRNRWIHCYEHYNIVKSYVKNEVHFE